MESFSSKLNLMISSPASPRVSFMLRSSSVRTRVRVMPRASLLACDSDGMGKKGHGGGNV